MDKTNEPLRSPDLFTRESFERHFIINEAEFINEAETTFNGNGAEFNNNTIEEAIQNTTENPINTNETAINDTIEPATNTGETPTNPVPVPVPTKRRGRRKGVKNKAGRLTRIKSSSKKKTNQATSSQTVPVKRGTFIDIEEDIDEEEDYYEEETAELSAEPSKGKGKGKKGKQSKKSKNTEIDEILEQSKANFDPFNDDVLARFKIWYMNDLKERQEKEKEKLNEQFTLYSKAEIEKAIAKADDVIYTIKNLPSSTPPK